METPLLSLEDVMPKTDYFKGYLERLLSHLYPALICPKLIVKIILHGPRRGVKRMLASEAAKTLNLKFHVELVANIIDDNIVGTDKKIRSFFAKLSTTEPCLIYLSGCEILCYYGERDLDVVEYSIKESLKELLDRSTQPIILIASTNDFDRFSKTSLYQSFHYGVCIAAPLLSQAKQIVEFMRNQAVMPFDPTRVLSSISDDGRQFNIGDIILQIEKAQLMHSNDQNVRENIHEADEDTRWMDIGRLADIKQEIIDTIQLPIESPQLKKSGERTKGILLHGPPGTGKTLLAKAVATECSLKFFNLRGRDLMKINVFQIMNSLRSLFQKACDDRPSVLFIEDIHMLAPDRGQPADPSGPRNIVLGQLISEFKAMRQYDDFYVIGATIDRDLIDQCLFDKGKFGKVLKVPLPVSREDRILILQVLTREMKLADDVDLFKLEGLAKPNMSGADFHGLCKRAEKKASHRCVQMVKSGEKTEEEVDIATRMGDFLEAIADG